MSLATSILDSRILSRRTGPRSTSARLPRSEEHTSELQSRLHLVCRLLLEKNHDRLLKGRTEFDHEAAIKYLVDLVGVQLYDVRLPARPRQSRATDPGTADTHRTLRDLITA